MKHSTLTLLCFSLCLATTACKNKSAERSEIEIENERLRTEIEKLKLQQQQSMAPTSPKPETPDSQPEHAQRKVFLESRPPQMSEKEFIENHSDFQDQEQEKEGLGDTLALRYKAMYEKNKNSYNAYLYLRAMDDEQQEQHIDEFLKLYPESAFLNGFKANILYQIRNPTQVDEALKYTEKAMAIDKNTPIGKYYEEMKLFKKTADALPALKVTFDMKELNRDVTSKQYTIQPIGPNTFRIVQSRKESKNGNYVNVRTEHQLSLKFVKTGPITINDELTGGMSDQTPGFQFAFEVTPADLGVNILNMGVDSQSKGRPTMNLTKDEVQKSNGKILIPLDLATVSQLKEFRITSFHE